MAIGAVMLLATHITDIKELFKQERNEQRQKKQTEQGK